LADGYWPIPALCVVVAAGLSIGLLQVDESLQRGGTRFAFTGGPESARSLLSTIATSTLSLTALVFSITILVLQLASSQFSPRALRSFLRDRESQLTLGVFLATFVFSLIALRAVRGREGLVDRFVPGVTISVAFLLVVLSVGFFVRYIHHIAQSIRVTTLIERIGEETRQTIARLHRPDADAGQRLPELDDRGRVVAAEVHGSVVHVDVERLVAMARALNGVIAVVPRVGGFVAAGQPVLRVVTATAIENGVRDEDLRVAVRLEPERSAEQDVGFGLRQLVDIAERALSPGTNDPSTAVQCLDQLHDLLRHLGTSAYPSAVRCDDDGEVRVIVHFGTWEEHVALALDELRLWGRSSLQVRRRMEALVVDLLGVVEGARRQPLIERVPLWIHPLEPA
jgi:uncharacterized membrane protein